MESQWELPHSPEERGFEIEEASFQVGISRSVLKASVCLSESQLS